MDNLSKQVQNVLDGFKTSIRGICNFEKWSGKTLGVLFNFKQVDKKATIKHVKRFFNSDVPQLEQVSNMTLNGLISSPHLDEVAHHSNTNGQEAAIINAVDANRELMLVVQSIRECTEESAKLLKLRYIQHLAITPICIRLGLDSTTLYRHLDAAFLEFAYKYAAHGRDLKVYC